MDLQPLLAKNEKFKVLVIDDDRINVRVISRHLEESYSVIAVEGGKLGVETALTVLPDLVLLDLYMPDSDGFEVCRTLRENERTKDVPIIIVTGSNEVESRVKAYEAGADDLLVKPFTGSELMARVHSKTRRLLEKRRPRNILFCGNLQIDIQKYEVWVESSLIELSVMEFKLLQFLVENKNRVLSRDSILDHVWNGFSVTRRTIDTHVLSLRKKLTAFDQEITSVYGVGYGIKSKDL